MLSQFQKFEIKRIQRSKIQFHPKNPRIINDSAKNKIKSNINDIGLLQPLIVNENTGYLLGGHQRLSCLDSLEKYKDGKNDYEIDISVVNLNEKDELKMLVFLNNQSAQGDWDIESLADISLGGEINFKEMGFDAKDIEFMFYGDDRFCNGESIMNESAEVNEEKFNIEQIKAAKKESRNKMKQNDLDNSDYYVVIVCENHDQKKEMMNKINMPSFEKYVSFEKIKDAFK